MAEERQRKAELEAEAKRKAAGLAAEAQRRAAEKASEARPVDYGWQPDARVVVVDMVDVSDHYLRAKIFAAVRQSRSSLETHVIGALLVVRIAGTAEGIQLALRKSRLPLELSWGSNTRLVVSLREVSNTK